MTGMFCDNQPDFTWLMPHEEKTFTQYFMPYKAAGYVKNASADMVLNLEKEDGTAQFTVYATGKYEDARVVLTADGQTIYDRTLTLSPISVLQDSVTADAPETSLRLAVYDKHGRELLAYAPQEKKIEKIPDPAPAAKLPHEIQTIEELYLTGLHIEQYRHATYLPDPYYLEALKRDPGDIRANNAYGTLLLRRGMFMESEAYFRRAIQRMTEKNPNPYDSEAYVNLGLALLYQESPDKAYDAFYKATWSAAQQEAAFYHLAAIDCRRGDYRLALSHIDRSLVRNYHSLKARALRGMILTELGREKEAAGWFAQNLELDAFDYVSRIESGDVDGALMLMAGRESSFIECAIDYAEAGFYQKAVAVLDLCPAKNPMAAYHKALYAARYDSALAKDILLDAAQRDSLYCFPNRLEDICSLQHAMYVNPADAKAPYYLGCLYYDKRQYEKAAAHWERSARLDGSFPTVWRNLALAYYNKQGKADKARTCLERAYQLDESDARVLLELDQLYRKLNMPIGERFAFLDSHKETVFIRDDRTIEYCTLLNSLGRHEEALKIIMSRKFHPWEGGEGKVTTQYAASLTQLARSAMAMGKAAAAKELLERALIFPHNLGEGKLEGAKDNNIYYYLGLCARMLGDEHAAHAYLSRAAMGDEEPASAMYYNDQPAEMILYQGLAARALGDEARASARLHKLVAYGEKHYYDEVKIDYFAVSRANRPLCRLKKLRKMISGCFF